MTYPLRVNGELHTVDVDGDTPLLWVLRDVLGFNGTKFGCGMGLCGACTVHVDGRPARSCVIAVQTLGEASITTIESASTLAVGRHVQQAWLARNVPQCGYCQSGQIMAAISLILRTQHPSDADIDAAMSGNLCRCGTYVRIRAAVKDAAAAFGAEQEKIT